MDIQQLTEDIRTRANNADPIDATLKFKMDDQVVFLDGTGSENVVSNEDKEADCTIKISQDNLGKLLSGNLNPMMAFTMGKVKVEGDLGIAMKLQALM